MIEEKPYDSEIERSAVIALVMSDKAISSAFPYLEPKLFSNFVTQNVADWCLSFYKQFGKAPKQHIQDLFLENKEKLDESTTELTEIFLSNLSSTFEMLDDYNEEYATAQVFKHINLMKINNLIDDLGVSFDHGNPDKGIQAISEFRKAEQATSEVYNPLLDIDRYIEEADQEESVLFQLKGGLGQLLGPINRSTFYSIVATEKRGKSFLLFHIAETAARNKRKVLFISAGDMTLKEIAERNLLTATNIDRRYMNQKRTVFEPILDCEYGQKGKCPLGVDTGKIVHDYDRLSNPQDILENYPNHIPCSSCKKATDEYDRRNFKPTPWWKESEVGPYSEEIFKSRLEKYKKRMDFACGKAGFLHVQFYPTKSLSPEMIENILIKYQEDGNPIDVLCIDYADILAEPARANRMDERNKVNAIWEELRRISQVYNLSLWLPTQGNRNMYKSDAEQGDVSEDKRKAAHVTGMIALNQSEHEQDQGILRISALFLRNKESNRMKEVKMLQCLSLGKPHIDSFLVTRYKTKNGSTTKSSKKGIITGK